MAKRPDRQHAMYVISIAAELAGVHPQTLRVYERKGLVNPHRTEGNTRRYSDEDITLLRKIQELTNEGINLAGVTRILQLEKDLQTLARRYEKALQELETREHQAMVPMRDVRRVRRAMKADFVDEAGRRRTWPAPPVGGDY
jgi:MerR family transcriptional regulator, heat shock protein HspR